MTGAGQPRNFDFEPTEDAHSFIHSFVHITLADRYYLCEPRYACLLSLPVPISLLALQAFVYPSTHGKTRRICLCLNLEKEKNGWKLPWRINFCPTVMSFQEESMKGPPRAMWVPEYGIEVVVYIPQPTLQARHESTLILDESTHVLRQSSY
jgi:hypothetical protein